MMWCANERAVARTLRRFVTEPADVEDLMQIVAFTAFKRLHQFAGRGTQGAWLRRVATNTAHNWLRSQARTSLRDTAFAREDLIEADWCDSGSSEDGEAGSRRPAPCVSDMLKELTPREREVVTLRILRGLSTAEAAAAMGVAPGRVASTLARALNRLRQLGTRVSAS
jgi:RNA polymerase sigma-70 factor (ECF subfamily)